MKHSLGVEFLSELGLVLVAALVGGLVARALRLPVLVGYLLAGLVVGPHTPGFIADERIVRTVADLGVVLLMFAVGVQFSWEELNHVRRPALIGGGVQIVGTILLGVALGLGLGWGAYGGLFVGCALALSSTAVMLKILEERGELGTTHGSLLLGILVIQDLSLVLMIALLPALANLGTQGIGALTQVGIALLKAIAFLTVTLLLATRGVPLLLERILRTGSRELFLLTAISLCLLAGFAAERLGLGIALGAFLAGIVIAESGYADEVFTQVRPLRDVFASLFFVSVGMLLDPRFLVAHWPAILGVLVTILVGKPLVTMAPLLMAGIPVRTFFLVGLGLAQIGEFSFVLATLGAERGLVGQEVANVILSAALISIFLAPFVYGSAGTLSSAALGTPFMARLLRRNPSQESGADTGLTVDGEGTAEGGKAAHVIILGAGRVGRYVSDALRAVEIRHTVVDYDSNATNRLSENGVRVILGDATSEAALILTYPQQASLAVIALPEATTTEMALRLLKQMVPSLPVLVRVHRGIDIPRMRAAGADAVIHAEFEASTEMIRQGFSRLGIADNRIGDYIEAMRQHRYRQETSS